jgi:hypothetical protein
MSKRELQKSICAICNTLTLCYDELCSHLIALSKVLAARSNNDCASRVKEKVLSRAKFCQANVRFVGGNGGIATRPNGSYSGIHLSNRTVR